MKLLDICRKTIFFTGNQINIKEKVAIQIYYYFVEKSELSSRSKELSNYTAGTQFST